MFFIELIDIFLADEFTLQPSKNNLVVYHYAKKTSGKLFKESTYQLDLQQDEQQLLENMTKGNRSKLRRSKKEPYVVTFQHNPTDEELKQFQQFYNAFAKTKRTQLLTSLHMKRLKMLRDKGLLVLTKLQNHHDDTLCYQIRLIDGDFVLSLYGCIALWLQERPNLKQPIRYANRYLLWENIMYFKKMGYKTYDYGGATSIDEINKFKEDFGFNEVTTYHGLETNSVMGKFLKLLHRLKIIYLF